MRYHNNYYYMTSSSSKSSHLVFCEMLIIKFVGLKLESTVDVEKFAELNVHSFSLIEILAKIPLRSLGQKCLLFSIINERHLYSQITQKNFCSILENRENHISLAQ